MSKIQVLDPITIDKIAAGEVIERPRTFILFPICSFSLELI